MGIARYNPHSRQYLWRGAAGRAEFGGAAGKEFGEAGGAGAEVESHFRIDSMYCLTSAFSSSVSENLTDFLAIFAGGRPAPGWAPPCDDLTSA